MTPTAIHVHMYMHRTPPYTPQRHHTPMRPEAEEGAIGAENGAGVIGDARRDTMGGETGGMRFRLHRLHEHGHEHEQVPRPR